MVLIGGDRRPHAYEALKSAFCLKDLIWIVTREHESTDLFVPYIPGRMWMSCSWRSAGRAIPTAR